MIGPSFWLPDSGDDLAPRPSLSGDATVDVAILGGGYSGLWTAYHLLRGDPSLEVAIVERKVCGFGASGRNGGWCSPRFPVDLGALIRRFGAATARDVLRAQLNEVAAIGDFCASEGIDAEYRQTGLLGIARGDAQCASLGRAFQTYAALGFGEISRLLTAEETFERVHVTRLTGGLETSAGATIHPGKLVRGLARTVERLGGRIYEGTEAIRLVSGDHPAIITDRGVLHARKSVVAAGEAYLSSLSGFRRSLMPMASMIVLTEPLTATQWNCVGWANGESLSSQAHTKDYLTRTADGRILYGSRGPSYRFGSRMPESALADDEIFEWMRNSVRSWWPALTDLQFSHAWGGYVGVPRDWMPTVSYDEVSGLAQLHGYTGRGVTTSAIGGRLLAGLIGGWKTGLEALPFHRTDTPRWEPEPLRWAGVRYVQNAFSRIDKADQASRQRPIDTHFAEYLGEP
jgi:glycine/D-amino acid oxidase-like deaminating enzyme